MHVCTVINRVLPSLFIHCFLSHLNLCPFSPLMNVFYRFYHSEKIFTPTTYKDFLKDVKSSHTQGAYIKEGRKVSARKERVKDTRMRESEKNKALPPSFSLFHTYVNTKESKSTFFPFPFCYAALVQLKQCMYKRLYYVRTIVSLLCRFLRHYTSYKYSVPSYFFLPLPLLLQC